MQFKPMRLAGSEQGMGWSRFGAFVAAAAIMCGGTAASWAAAPRVLPEGKTPADVRLQPPKDLDGYFPFQPSPTPEAWKKRAEELKRHMFVALGLWPMPQPTPLNPVIHGKVERDGYTVERVYLESFPGFFVTGSLYRPVGRSGKLAGVLCPHGHWADGRFYDTGKAAVLQDIVNGAERFEEGGRSPLQARCVQLAKMGCVVFHYDMIGYADSQQLSFDLAHRFAKQRPEMNTPENWGLYSPRAEAHLQSIMGLQTYNSIRSLDFLLSLPDVDASRIGVTGASGGGTQTFILGALDPRPAVSYPAVMVSTAMQGGCTCENCSLLRIDTGNVEFAALFAPKPLGMSAADDWTKEMGTKGFPELKKHYQMLGAPDNVFLKPTLHFGHNYNYVNRAAMYAWFNKHLKLGQSEPVVEGDYKRLSREELTVWDAQHPTPPSGPEFERKLLRYWTEDAQKQLAALVPSDATSLVRYREVVGGAVASLIGRSLPASADVEYEQTQKVDQGSYLRMAGLLKNKSKGEELPMVFLHPKSWNGRVVVWLSGQGKASLFQDSDQPRADVQEMLANGASVVGVDLLYQGEFLADGKPLEKTPRVKNTREFAGYTFGFNSTVFARRVHDVLNVLAFVHGHKDKPQRVDLVGLEGAGPIAAAARAVAADSVQTLAVDTQGFRFAQVDDLHDPNFQPGGAKYGDVPALLALGAPGQAIVAGEGTAAPDLIKRVYEAAGAKPPTMVSGGGAEARAALAAALQK
ncbi:MAG: acetylxylan esterase [Pirellulales bacterium]